jgi:hypothetical protein
MSTTDDTIREIDRLRAANADLQLHYDEAITDAKRYQEFFRHGLPITFLGFDYDDKTSLDAAIDAAIAERHTCRKCGGAMKPGKYIVPHVSGSPDLDGEPVTMSVSPGPAKLADCLKCEACGHSVIGDVS